MTANTLALVGDIGGTNARFALTDLSSPTIELLESRALAERRFREHAARDRALPVRRQREAGAAPRSRSPARSATTRSA
jgi:glucokinase